MDANGGVTDDDRKMLKDLVTSLLREKPSDPVPFIYNFLAQKQQGIQSPAPLSNHEVSQIRNLRLKIEDLESRLNLAKEEHTASEDEDDNDSDDAEYQKKIQAAGSRKARQGVSAEVFGTHNKKEDFVPKVIPKLDETKSKLKKRLLQAFMFNALDEKELKIVIDAIEEVHYKSGDDIIVQGDAGDCMFVLESGSLKCSKVFAG